MDDWQATFPGSKQIPRELTAFARRCKRRSHWAQDWRHASEPAAPSQIYPPVSINVLMVMFVDQAADAIWAAAVYPPKGKCEWEQVEYRATELATTGTLLRLGGTTIA